MLVANFEDSYKSVEKKMEKFFDQNRVKNLKYKAVNIIDEFCSVIPILHQV